MRDYVTRGDMYVTHDEFEYVTMTRHETSTYKQDVKKKPIKQCNRYSSRVEKENTREGMIWQIGDWIISQFFTADSR
jgi:hypothetical protein